MLSSRVDLLQSLITGSFERGGWVASADEALSGLEAEDAAFRPGPGAHTIWELVRHLSFWEDLVTDRLGGMPLGPGRISNKSTFDGCEPEDRASWKEAAGRLLSANRRLAAAVGRLEDAQLDQPLPGEQKTLLKDLLEGMALHQAYHLGQIVLLRKLLGKWPPA
jgi:uncharacterized damage-inducible protein DinB